MVEDYDNDIIMMISDWYHTDSGSLLSWYLSTASQGVEVIVQKIFFCLIGGLFPWARLLTMPLIIIISGKTACARQRLD